MLRLLLFDLRRLFAPRAGSLQAAACGDLAGAPPELRSDMGLSDARLADEVQAQVCSALAARHADEARRLRDVLDRIARKRGFSGVRWRSEGMP